MGKAEKIIRGILNNHNSRTFSSEIEGYNFNHAKSNCPPVLNKTVDVTHENLYELNLDVSFLRKKCMGDNNLSELFRNYIGITPKKYINVHRIHISKRLLKKKELENVRISKISFEIGYKHSSTFGKAFKRIEKITPARWRDQH